MLDSIATKRPSRRCSLWLASLITAAPLALPLNAEQPSAHSDRGPASQLAPRRLPSVPQGVSGTETGDGIEAATPSVQTCSVEVDQLVESWFADPEGKAQADPSPARWLRSTSSSAAEEVARRLIAQSTREFEVGAWLSAETSAWNAVRWGAESVDLAARERGEPGSATALRDLGLARDAIREARDFSGIYGPVDGDAIQRMALSHQTNVLDNQPMDVLTATDASDRYLDHARVLLAPIARQSLEAAQGMDLLAAIQLGRADAKTLPSATALCLRRAALQGQPGNASLASRLGMHLADVGLLSEARWALEHSLRIENDPTTAIALANVLRRTGHVDEASRLTAQIQNQLSGPSRLAVDPSTTQRSSGDFTVATAGDGTQVQIPEIVELSPQEFASISQSVIPIEKGDRSIQATPASVTIASSAVRAAEQNPNPSADAPDEAQAERPGMIRQFFRSLKRVW